MSDVAESELLAEAIVAELNASALATALSLVFQYEVYIDFQLKEIADRTLVVVRDLDDVMTIAGGSRSQWMHEYPIQVSLLRQVGSDRPTAAGSRVKYALEQIASYYKYRTNVAGRTERLMRAEGRTLWDPAEMQAAQVVKSQITLVFRGFRAQE